MVESLERLKASAIPIDAVLGYMRIDPEYADASEREAAASMYAAALSHVCERCGIDLDYADAHPDIAVAVLALARDMYDNRTLYADKPHPNRAVESILGLHDMNLL